MKIQDTKINKPPKIFLYGKPGHGKSRFFASCPNPLFIQTEDRLAHLSVKSGGMIDSYNELIDQLTWVRDAEHDFKTVVIDTGDSAQKFIEKEICRIAGCSSITDEKKLAYYVGYVKVAEKWEKEILPILTEINEKRKMIVAITSHLTVSKVEHPQYGEYDQYQPSIDKRSAKVIKGWADIAAFLDMRAGIKNQDEKEETVRFRESSQRVLRLRPQPYWDTKESYNLPDYIDLPTEKPGEFLGWKLLAEAIRYGVGIKEAKNDNNDKGKEQ